MDNKTNFISKKFASFMMFLCEYLVSTLNVDRFSPGIEPNPPRVAALVLQTFRLQIAGGIL